jgi:hypothetical protein
VVSAPDNCPAQSLRRFLNIPGGISVAEAEERAALHLETLRARSEADMQDSLASLGQYMSLLQGAPTPALRQEMHRLSCCIINLGGTFGRAALSKAGYSFCRLLDDLEGGWDRAAADVHFAAMKLLFTPEQIPAEAQTRILDGLNKVRVRAVSGARRDHG